MAMKLIHFPHARSLRVVWALKELGLETDLQPGALVERARGQERRAVDVLANAPVDAAEVLQARGELLP